MERRKLNAKTLIAFLKILVMDLSLALSMMAMEHTAMLHPNSPTLKSKHSLIVSLICSSTLKMHLLPTTRKRSQESKQSPYHQMLNEKFKTLQSKFKKNPDFILSGTCAVAVIVFPEIIFSLNIGDSRAVLCNLELNDDKPVTKTAIELSIDHKPSRDIEKERIIKCGGKIERQKSNNDEKEVGPLRIWKNEEEGPGIAITRSLGDILAHTIGVLHEPEITFRMREPGDKFIVMGSDGIWDMMTSAESIGFVLCCEK